MSDFFIMSNFSYCPLVWHFCSKTSTDKMEKKKLQYRARRVVFIDFDSSYLGPNILGPSSYADLLTKANMSTLQLDRTRILAREVFKNFHHENIPIYNFDPFKPHFYIVKLGFTGVYIIFLSSAQKHRVWVLFRTVSARLF